MNTQSLINLAIVLNLFSVASLIIYLLSDYWRRSHALLHDAGKQVNRILSEAQLDSIKALANEKLSAKKLEQRYKRKLNDLQKSLASQLKKSADLADKQYEQFNRELEKAINATITRQREILELRSDSFFSSAHEQIEKFIKTTQEQVSENLTREMDAAKKDIADYRRQRLQLIDDQLIRILEQTLAATLQKKLNLKDQMELAYKALKRAKQDNVL